MKKLLPIQLILTTVILILSLNFSHSQSIKLNVLDYSIKLPEGQVNFRIDETKMVLKFKDNILSETIKQFLISQKIFEEFDSSWFVPFPKGIMIAKIKEQNNSIFYLQKLANIQQNEIIEFSAPVLIYNQKTQQALYNLFYVKLLNGSDYELLKKYSIDLNFEIEKEYEKDIYFCRVNKQSIGNAFEIVKFLQDKKIFDFIEPDFIYTCELNTNDTYYNQQWALNNTGQSVGGVSGNSGADIEIVKAWKISTGSSIKVAILDCFGSSSQFSHSDFSFSNTYDATGTGFSSTGNPEDAHGIACGSVIGASTNNSTGLAGVAYNSKVIAVKIGTITSKGKWNATGNSISDGITWAYQNADVISNSNSFGSSSSLVDNAISNSINKGRSNKKGAPFFSSSGNDNSSTIGYPASNSNTIAVGASSLCDERKNKSSCDGETWWGADYGTGLDIAAPGVKIHSADIAGSAGFVSGDYLLFNGTSSACPIAAGVMALILSADPTLSYTDARAILESTCEKVGGYTYNSSVSGQPNGTWSSNLGYGRINAYQALLKVNKPDLTITASTQNVSPTNVTAGSNITVGCSEDNNSYSSAGSNSVTIWLSPSKTLITGNSVYLGQISGFPALSGKSNSKYLSTSLKIPTNTCAGTYYVFFWADGNQVVSESDETNNFVYVTVNISSNSPTTQASGIAFSNISTNQMTVKWTNGNGTRRIVYINTSNSFTSPSDGTNPSANSNYSGSGQQPIYNNNGNSVTVSGLNSNTSYYFRVYEAKCTGSSSLYQTSTVSNNPNNQTTSSSCTVPINQASNITFSNLSTTQMNVNWSIGSGTRNVVYINTSNSFTPPSNGSNPSPNSTYSGSGQQPIYNNSGNSVTVAGLNSNTTYYFRVYEANCSGTSSMYQTSTASNNPNSQSTPTSCSTPNTQASNISFSGTSASQVTVTWSNGNGSRRVVCINTANNFSPPYNGTDPSPNTNYGGSGSQVIYNGSGNSVTVDGLSAGTTYYFRVYEANCAGSNSQYQTSTNSSNPNSQNTSTGGSCTTPQTPTPQMGSTICPGPGIWGTSTNLSWSNSGTGINYDYVITEYPFGESNIVFTGNCVSTWMAFISGLTDGKLYQWYVRSTSDCISCNSPWSESNFFQVAPLINEGLSVYVCNGNGTTLTTPQVSVPSPGSVSYQWYKRNGANLVPVGSNSSTYFVSTTGTYCVKLIYSGSNFCGISDTTVQSLFTYVSVATIPNAPTLKTNSPVCQGNLLTLSATGPSNSAYFWTGPNGFISPNNNIYIQAADTNNKGIYTCFIENQGCQSQSSSMNVDINLAPSAAFSYINNGNKVTFSNTSTNASNYFWNFGDGQTSTQSSPTHTYASNGNYNACLTANKSSCNSSSNCQLIRLGTEPKVSTQPTFAKLFNDTSANHIGWVASDIIQSPIDSGYIFLGWYQIKDDGKNVLQYFKIDKNGNLKWVRELPGNYSATGYQIIKSNRGYLISFYYSGNYSAIMEIDELGNKLWSKQFNSIGGSYIYLQKVVNVKNGYVGCGISNSGFNIIKIDTVGNIVWQKTNTYSLFSHTSLDINKLITDSDENLYIVGFVSDAQGNKPWLSNDGIVIKLDQNGDELWSKYYASGYKVQDVITSIVEDNNKDLVICGWSRDSSFNFTGFISKVNSSGTITASKKISGQYANRLAISNNKNISCLINDRLVELNSSIGIVKQKAFNFKFAYIIKATLDNKFIASSFQYPVNSSGSDYRYSIFKTSFIDTSCLDTSISPISLDNFSMSLSSMNPSSANPNFTTSSFTINSTTSFLKDTSICKQPTACTFTLSDSSYSFGSYGGVHFVNLEPSISSCTWSIINLNSWVHVLPTTLQTGKGTISITVDSCKNTSSRSGTLTIGDITYSIYQNCNNTNPCKPPVAKFAASQTSGNVPFTVDFFDLSTTKGQTSWQWTIYNGTPQPIIRTTQNPTGIQYDNPGSYLVKLLVVDSCGSNDLIVGNFITANASSGFQSLNNYGIKVYPNPTKGLFMINFGGINNEKTILIYDALGKIIKQVSTANFKTEIYLQGFAQGIYFIRIKSEIGVFNSKLVLE